MLSSCSKWRVLYNSVCFSIKLFYVLRQKNRFFCEFLCVFPANFQCSLIIVNKKHLFCSQKQRSNAQGACSASQISNNLPIYVSFHVGKPQDICSNFRVCYVL